MKNNNNRFFTLAAVLCVSVQAPAAVLPVVDAVHIGVNKAAHTLDYIEQLIMENESVEQTIKLYQQYEQLTEQIEQAYTELERMGDPKETLNLAGADGLIARIGEKSNVEYWKDQAEKVDGATILEEDLEGAGKAIGQTFTVRGGDGEAVEKQRNADLYKEPAALNDKVNAYIAQETVILGQRQELTGEVARTAAQLKEATTDAEVQKLSGVLSAQQAQLANLDGQLAITRGQVEMYLAQQRALEDARRRAAAEEAAAQADIGRQKMMEMLKPAY